MFSETDIQVDAWLAKAGVTYKVVARGQTRREDWDCDEWAVFLTRPGKRLDLPFFTGLGHRELSKTDAARLKQNYGGSRNYQHEKAKLAKPVAPPAAGPLYAYTLDASMGDMSFFDWCDDFGYSRDSIKAMNTYHECCAIKEKLVAFFTRSEIEELRTLLENY